MTLMLSRTSVVLIAASLVFASCAGHGNADKCPPVANRNAKAGKSALVTSRNTKADPALGKPSFFAKLSGFSLASLMPGPGVKVVQVRKKDLKDLPTGRERALAFENQRKQGFWFFGGPVDFKEPKLPESGSELDGSLLPPRIP